MNPTAPPRGFAERLRNTDRVLRLVQAFEHIARTRMAGVPVMNPALRVEAVGFAPRGSGTGAAAEHALAGVLVTPWFMNLVWLPADGAATPPLPIGALRERGIGGHVLGFTGADAEGAGRFEVCSLVSPMFQFDGPAAARAAAHEVLDLLFANAAPQAPAAPARRAFLLGRAAAREVAP